MTPSCDDQDINLNAKTDREILIMLVGKVNNVSHVVEKEEEVLFNNGWGIVAQVKVMWGIGVILLGLVIKALSK